MTAKKKCFVSERKVTPYGQSKGFVRYPLKKICGDLRLPYDPCADPENFPGGVGGGVQIPRRGITENFNMAKINNLAIITRREGGGVQIPRRGITENFNMAKINNLAIITRREWGGGGPDPLSPPLDPPMRSA